MPDFQSPPPPDSTDPAALIKQLEEEGKRLLQRQWRNLLNGAGIISFLVALALVIGVAVLRTPMNADALAKLEKSGETVAQLTLALARATPSCDSTGNGAASATASSGSNTASASAGTVTWCDQVRQVIYEYNAEQKKAVAQLRESDKKLGPDALALIQLAGGAGILALLGYLGLMRLQNLDQELHNMRESTFSQISTRVSELRGTIIHDVTQELSEEQNALRSSTERTKAEIEQSRQDFHTDLAEATKNFSAQAEKIQTNIAETLEKYPWLKNDQLRDDAANLDDLQSAEQAHDLATEFADKDKRAATAALEAILSKNLPGDRTDFHNAHSQAMRMDNPVLGLQLAERGLEFYPNDYDLVADKAVALQAAGRNAEARAFLEQWRQKFPDEFARSWRPMVTYAKVVQNDSLSAQARVELENSFQDAVARAPYEIKIWSTYGRFLRDIGRRADAITVLRQGLNYNPFGQEVHFVLGETLLQGGDHAEAVAELEKAVLCDYQDQFQHDVNQAAIVAMLAQAYEADGQSERASATYQAALQMPNALPQIKPYARSRLRMISLLTGQKIDTGETSQLADLLSMLQQARAQASDEDEDEDNA